MPRPLSPAQEREFQELFSVLEFWVAHVAKTATIAEQSAREACDDIERRFGRSKALKGLRMAVHDILEDLQDVPAERLASLDEHFRAAGLVSLSELRRRYASVYKRIVKRGAIRNDTEYYLINGIVVDLRNEIADEERARLQHLLDSYELATTGGSPSARP